MTVKRHALAQRRRVVGYTQEQLAAVLGVERSTVVRWEAGGTTPQPWCRPKLAEALAVSVDELDTMLIEGQTVEGGRSSNPESRADGQLLDLDAAAELPDDRERDLVLTAPWSHRGTVEAAIMLSGGDDSRVKRRAFLSVTGTALTAPAHQWLVHEPEPLVSGLTGRRVSARLADRLPAMIAELRTISLAAAACFRWRSTSLGGSLSYWIRPLTMRSPVANSSPRFPNSGSLRAGALMIPGNLGWRSDTTSRLCGPHTVPTIVLWARTSLVRWLSRPPIRGGLLKPWYSLRLLSPGRGVWRVHVCRHSCISDKRMPWRECTTLRVAPRRSPRLATKLSTLRTTRIIPGCTGSCRRVHAKVPAVGDFLERARTLAQREPSD